MYSLLISLGVSILLWVVTALWIADSVWAGILPFIIALPLCFYLINRHFAKKFEGLTKEVEVQLSALTQAKSQQQKRQIMDDAVETLKKGYAYRRWLFSLSNRIDAQIGQIYYLQKRFKEAVPYLKRATSQDWVALGMLGCQQYRDKDYEAMRKTFDKALRFTKKMPLLWNLYAYCLLKSGHRDEAQQKLAESKTYIQNDKATQDNIDLLRNSGKMKMRSWNELWYQFHLDEPPVQKVMMQYDRRSAFRR